MPGKRGIGILTTTTASIVLLTTLCVVGDTWAEDKCWYYKGQCVPIHESEKVKIAKKPICVTPHVLCEARVPTGYIGAECFCFLREGGIAYGHVEDAD